MVGPHGHLLNIAALLSSANQFEIITVNKQHVKLQLISSQSDRVGVHVKPNISHCHCERTVTGISGGSGETGCLVFKKLQSSVRPEVLEELMGRGEEVSEL